MILQTMYQQSVKNQVRFFNEYLVLDLLINEGVALRRRGAADLRDGEIHTFHAKAVVFATGGYGRAWRVTSNALCLHGRRHGDCLSRAASRCKTWRCTSSIPRASTGSACC